MLSSREQNTLQDFVESLVQVYLCLCQCKGVGVEMIASDQIPLWGLA